LLAGIAESDLQTCINVLARIREKAEKGEPGKSITRQPSVRLLAEHNGLVKQGHPVPRKRPLRSVRRGFK
jgi:hypothetical protein